MIAETVSRNVLDLPPPRMHRKGPIEHDLPVLGATLAPTGRIDWGPLMEEGVTPSVALGAERRLRGPR